ncbi:MAG TPA: galactose oxidase early set domain-containing protein [Nocardioides sp.]|nr:galactose oxidase early set domain-containing protein [Nocardioides sp.]
MIATTRGARHWFRVSSGALAATLVVALAATAGARPAQHRQLASQHVCGSLTPDAKFSADVRQLGTDHACEHLASRQFTASATQQKHDTVERRTLTAALSSTDPVDIGQWSNATNPGTKTIGISAVLLHTGKVLLFGGKYKSTDKNTAAYLFDPTTFTGHEVPAPAAVFCGSVTPLSDGRILSVGGTVKIPQGIVDVWLFDPVRETWTRQPDTPLGRYYPTSTRMSDGTVVVAAGTELDGVTKNPTVEQYTPPAAGSDVGTLQVVGPNHVTGYYPHQWLMPDGTLLQADAKKSYKLDPTSWTWSALPSLPGGDGPGSSSMLLPGGPGATPNVMIFGGLLKSAAQTSTEVFDYSNPSAGWHYGTPMPTPRAHMNIVQVPDGSAFGIGGNASGLYDVGEYQTLHFDPATQTWSNMAVQSVRRGYHSTAVLLPDGRIMSAGDTGAGGGRQLIDFYSPPYLFQGPRPAIDSAPNQVDYGAGFDIATSGPAVGSAVLMSPGATTHAVEMNARRVQLAVTPTATGFTATAPASSKLAPPGWYMLFVVTPDGIPSVATWVHVGP